MESLKELKSKDLSEINGGFVWVPLAIKAAKIVGAAAAAAAGAYVGTEVTDGVARGIAGGEYVDCK